MGGRRGIGWDKPFFLYSYDGTNLTTFSGGAITGTGPGADCPYTWWEEIVLALCEYEGDLVIGGNFFRADSLPVSNLVSFTTSGAAILGDARGLGAGEYTSFLGADDAGVTVLGPDPQCFTVGGFQSYDLDTWDGSTWRKIGVWTGFYPFISMNTVVDGRLYLAGRGFVASGDTLSYQSMAVWNGQQWESGPPVYGYDDSQYFFVKPMYCMARYGSTFVAGGAIPPPGGDEDTETQVGILNGDVSLFTVLDGCEFVSGHFY